MKKKGLARLFEIIEIGAADDMTSRFYDFFGVFCVIINLTALILSTFDGIAAAYGDALSLIETATVFYFLADYLLRVLSARYLYPEKEPAAAALRYMTSFTGLVDLLSFLPFFLPFFIPAGAVAFRLFRIARVFRLFRIGVYYDSLNVITEVLKNKRQQLLSSVFIIFVLMLAASLCMYSIENRAQPGIFRNAFSGIWWAVSTLLTVGYGDIYPVTVAGKAFSIILTFLGVGLVAIPTGIISAGFVEQYGVIKRRADFLKETDVNFIKFGLRETDDWNGKSVSALGLPENIMLAAVRRGRETIIPDEKLTLQAGDGIVMASAPYNDYQDVHLREIVLSERNNWVGKQIGELEIARNTLIITVRRGERILSPHGTLTLKTGDRLMVFDHREVSKEENPTQV